MGADKARKGDRGEKGDGDRPVTGDTNTPKRALSWGRQWHGDRH